MAVTIPKDLIEAIRNNRCGLYIGAGVSEGAGLPGWPKLLEQLIDLAKEVANLSEERAEEFRKLAPNPTRYLMLAQELKDILPSELPEHIKKVFDDKTKQPTATHDAILEIKHKFIVTTNYDTLIEKAYVRKTGDFPTVLSYKDASTINYNIVSGEPFILKAHGDARSAPQDIVITEKDYRNIIYNQRGYQSVLQLMFSFYNVLFIGTSLNDPELNLLLGFIHNIFHGGSPNHYALISKDNLTNIEVDRWRKDFKVNIIGYDPKNGHEELLHIVQQLKDV
ncbi:SIR2 family NAD-dependent protein deacylase [Hymenobacter latericus]|uniref:SIR2 family NAD-dependent protein deacylase n=1 Tax=Hymenobacter sp. YIM 151858-1 TaxID=2987688 RepID=UPI002226AEA9|nr:SIR2 family protein [Hymenobacter sp. YIM 151858-1]UYZ61185.1 SIR2 family protein [Hymenobacter sp. YIM 151858-1]